MYAAECVKIPKRVCTLAENIWINRRLLRNGIYARCIVRSQTCTISINARVDILIILLILYILTLCLSSFLSLFFSARTQVPQLFRALSFRIKDTIKQMFLFYCNINYLFIRLVKIYKDSSLFIYVIAIISAFIKSVIIIVQTSFVIGFIAYSDIVCLIKFYYL